MDPLFTLQRDVEILEELRATFIDSSPGKGPLPEKYSTTSH